VGSGKKIQAKTHLGLLIGDFWNSFPDLLGVLALATEKGVINGEVH
jgi:hypothetical protein